MKLIWLIPPAIFGTTIALLPGLPHTPGTPIDSLREETAKKVVPLVVSTKPTPLTNEQIIEESERAKARFDRVIAEMKNGNWNKFSSEQ